MMKRTRCYLLFLLGTALALSGCNQTLPHRQGQYFDATIEDAHVIALKDSARIPALRDYVRDVRWQLDKPISGKFSVSLSENDQSGNFIGQLQGREPMEIISLTGASMETDEVLQRDESVRIGGAASVGVVDQLKENVLPVGDYVFRLKVHGSQNWDRKEIYVQVR